SVWMKRWKEEGMEKSKVELRREIQKIFPDDGKITETVGAVSKLLTELQDRASECLHIHDDVPVLQAYLDVFVGEIQEQLVQKELVSHSSNELLQVLDVLVTLDDVLA